MIFTQAFNPQAGLGGLLGVLITGFRRAAFSNEAGAGSASIAHSAVKTKYALLRDGCTTGTLYRYCSYLHYDSY